MQHTQVLRLVRSFTGVAAFACLGAATFASCSSSSGPVGNLGGTPGQDSGAADSTVADGGEDSSPPEDSTVGPSEASSDSASEAVVDVTAGDVAGDTSVTTSDASGDATSEAGDSGSCDSGGLAVCNGLCTNTQTDTSNCGMCANACGMGATCVLGVCQCNADAGQLLCANTCIDVLTDNGNCGSCGHTCQAGGTCSGGSCTATVIERSGGPIWGIALDTTYVWWTQPAAPGQPGTGNLYRKVKSTGGSAMQIFPSLNDPRGICTDNINVYWVDYYDTTVNQRQLMGGSLVEDWPPPLNDAGVQTGTLYADALAVAVDPAYVYWVSYLDGDILRVPINNTAHVAPTVIKSGELYPEAVAVDGTYVYWTDEGTASMPPYNGAVVQMAKDGSGTAITLASGEPSPLGIAVDAHNVYWVDNVVLGYVKQIPIGGGAIITLGGVAHTEGGPYGITVDATNVYWTDANDGTVLKEAIGGGPRIQENITGGTPTAIQVDGANLYWVDTSSATIYEVTK